ncbi:MAG TPA: tetratricopeptide repeat protein [Gaiellaceae bacterium]|jgi:predicted ATPase/class 3 adenylate cyclase
MAAQPTGTVTLLFSDIEGSTALLQRLGTERYAEALDLQRGLLREAFGRHGGYEVDCEGDAFFVSFGSASDAVAAAAEAQQALAGADWPDEGAIRVRMGLHTGEPLAVPPKYVGIDVHRAARIMAAAHGGQVLISQTTRDLLEGDVRDLGDHRLKDLSQPQRLFQLMVEGQPAEFPLPRTLENRPTNLPVVPTPLVGRARELDELAALLRGPTRLVTLTGPGGSGKTRLALQAAAEAVEAFSDGVFLVSLAALTDVTLVLPTIAQTLAVSERPAETLEETLGRFLSDRGVLLLLDNVEQVVEVATSLAGLLAGAPGLRILVTSREPLRVAGEREFPLDPLPVPEASESIDAARLSEFDSVALFIERALAVRPEFAVTNENAPAVAEICSRLDGLPLAIELAAARVRLLSPQALLSRLGERLALLTGGARGAPERQQTLRATIDWSFRLLSEPEQKLFSRLGVFVGGCRIEQAEVVADHDGSLGIDLLDGLQALVEKNLLRRRDDPDGEPRFWMLETIGEYALDALGDERTRSRRCHALAYLALAEARSAELNGPDETRASNLLEAERPNLRAGFDWAIQAGENEVLARLWIAMGKFWLNERGHLIEARAYLEPAIATATDSQSFEARALVLRNAYWTCAWLGEYDRAESLAEERIKVARASGDARLIAGALSSLSAATGDRGELRRAVELQQEAVSILREVGDSAGLASALINLGSCLEDVEDWPASRQACEEALSIWRRLGSTVSAAEAQQNLAHVLLIEGDFESAGAQFRLALPVLYRMGPPDSVAWTLHGLGLVALEEGDPERAATLCATRESLHRQSGYVPRPRVLELANRQLEPLLALREEAAVEAAWVQGEAMSIDDAVAYALAVDAAKADPPETQAPA